MLWQCDKDFHRASKWSALNWCNDFEICDTADMCVTIRSDCMNIKVVYLWIPYVLVVFSTPCNNSMNHKKTNKQNKLEKNVCCTHKLWPLVQFFVSHSYHICERKVRNLFFIFWCSSTKLFMHMYKFTPN